MKKKLIQIFLQQYNPIQTNQQPQKLLQKSPANRTPNQCRSIAKWLKTQDGFLTKLSNHKDQKHLEFIQLAAQFFTIKEYQKGAFLLKSGIQLKKLSILKQGLAACFQADGQTTSYLKKHKFNSASSIKQGYSFFKKQSNNNSYKITYKQCYQVLEKMGIVFQLHNIKFQKYVFKGDRIDMTQTALNVPQLSTATVICCQKCKVLQIQSSIVHEIIYQLQRSKHTIYYKLLCAGLFSGIEQGIINRLLKQNYMKMYFKNQKIDIGSKSCFIVLQGDINIYVKYEKIGMSLRAYDPQLKSNFTAFIARLGPGSSTGHSFFDIQIDENIYYKSTQQCKLLQLTQQLLQRLFKDNEEVYLKIKQNALRQYQLLTDLIQTRRKQRHFKIKTQHQQRFKDKLRQKMDCSIFTNNLTTSIKKQYEQKQFKNVFNNKRIKIIKKNTRRMSLFPLQQKLITESNQFIFPLFINQKKRQRNLIDRDKNKKKDTLMKSFKIDNYHQKILAMTKTPSKLTCSQAKKTIGGFSFY